jgi:transposase-like protein
VTVDRNPTYPKAVAEIKTDGVLLASLPFAAMQKYQNSIGEQDHRHIKRLVRSRPGFGGIQTILRTLAGFEAMIRKGQVRNIDGRDSRRPAGVHGPPVRQRKAA